MAAPTPCQAPPHRLTRGANPIVTEELGVDALKWTCFLLVEARIAVFAMGDVEFDGAPGRRRQAGDFGEQCGRATAQGEEGDAGGIEPVEPA